MEITSPKIGNVINVLDSFDLSIVWYTCNDAHVEHMVGP